MKGWVGGGNCFCIPVVLIIYIIQDLYKIVQISSQQRSCIKMNDHQTCEIFYIWDYWGGGGGRGRFQQPDQVHLASQLSSHPWQLTYRYRYDILKQSKWKVFSCGEKKNIHKPNRHGTGVTKNKPPYPHCSFIQATISLSIFYLTEALTNRAKPYVKVSATINDPRFHHSRLHVVYKFLICHTKYNTHSF